MISNTIQFYLERRRNTFQPGGFEWALNATFGDLSGAWTMASWEKKPSAETVKFTKEVILRSFEFYHNHLEIPRFEMKEVNTDEKGA